MSSPSGMSMPPLYSFPLMRLQEVIDMTFSAARTLKDAQLGLELEHLRTLCSEPGDHLAESMMFDIYATEMGRRVNPALRLDEVLDAALSRLERATNEADRERVREIGLKLFTIGGPLAMMQASQRMVGLARPTKQGLRRQIIGKRWAGIGGGK